MSAEFESMLARIRALPKLAELAAPDVADAVRDELRRSIAAGTSPSGEAWKLTKDGRQPLRNAASAMRCGAIGSVVYVRLTGPEALHSNGWARGRTRRQVIPSELTPQLESAVRAVLVWHFGELVHG